MCYAKVDGGYRCMPSQGLLKAYRGDPRNDYNPSVAHGAFWLNNSEPVPQLWEIQQEAAAFRYSMSEFSLSEAEYEAEVAHVGNMITRYSDAQVEGFERRLKEAQELYFSYKTASLDPFVSDLEAQRLTDKVIETNLALGYEVRDNLRNTLNEITSFKDPFSIKVTGKDPEFSSLLYSASRFFPSAWNRVLESDINLEFKYPSKASWFDGEKNEIVITRGSENFSSYPSMAAAQAAAAENMRKYETQVEMVHELSHKFETIDPRIYTASRAFLERRMLAGTSHDFDEEGAEMKDHFAHPYIGTTWGDRIHTEVFSMGMETTFLGTYGSLIGLALPEAENGRVYIYRADIEQRNLIVGIIAGLTPSFNRDTMGRPIKSVFGVDTAEGDVVLVP